MKIASKYFKKIAFLLLLMPLLLGACHNTNDRKERVIGLSQHTMGDQWRKAMVRDMQAAVSNYDHMRLEIRDAENDPQKQVAQIRELINQDVDVLVVSPIDSVAVIDVVEEARRKGIPTIITDRKINTEEYTTFIGGDNYEIGRKAGKAAAPYAERDTLQVAEIWGLASSTPAQERHRGFADELREQGITVITDSIQGSWRQDSTLLHLPELKHPERYRVVYSHNDVMAMATADYLRNVRAGADSSLFVIGVDAVPEAGLEAVADGRIDLSFLYPTAGEEIVRLSDELLNGDSIPRQIELPTVGIDKASAQNMLSLYERLQAYQNNLLLKKERNDLLLSRFRFLENSLTVILLLCLVLIALSLYIWRINKQVRIQNRALQEKNRIEEEQSRKLSQLNREIEEATAAKLRFFTNLSHEIRTPLTLVMAPLRKLLQETLNTPYYKELALMERNARRLLSEVNRMLDFRKIEEGAEVLECEEVAVEPFMQELKSYFDGLATLNAIHYTFSFGTEGGDSAEQHPTPPVRIDPRKMENVVRNLLSNAFKFTPRGGTISFDVRQTPSQLEIRIADTGSGIPAEMQQQVFERFYSAGKSHTGSGIGLYLVGKYVALHGGTVRVESEPDRFTRFIVTIPLPVSCGTDRSQSVAETMPDAADGYQLTPEKGEMLTQLLATKQAYSVLIVEDDPEIRNYLYENLGESFTVHQASNVDEAMRVLDKTAVSLVLSDVMMSGENGFELCERIKQDVNYAHIPVILLTALSMEEQQLYGFAVGADGYITKPFSVAYVKMRIIRLLQEKQKERERLMARFEQGERVVAEAPPGVDDQFLARLYEILEEVYTDSHYNVERLSDRMGMSRGHLYRKVKEITGLSPVEFLRMFRLKKARRLLQETHSHVSEVAYATGFSSPAYFSKCYKNAFGTTPSGD